MMMHQIASAGILLCVAQVCQAETDQIPVPSGQAVTWVDTIHTAPGPDGLTVRFRFLAPAIARDGGTVVIDDAFVDMAYLCETWAIPRLAALGPQPEQVIISLADQPVPFGEIAPEVTQLFEAYRPDGAACIWEGF